jgi:hypothetical protein
VRWLFACYCIRFLKKRLVAPQIVPLHFRLEKIDAVK